MKAGVLLALIKSQVTDAVEDSLTRGRRGPRGHSGPMGPGFDFDEHRACIQEIIKSETLKFSHLTESEVESLRGPQGETGERGPRGKDGKGFSFAEHESTIDSLIVSAVDGIKDSLKFKFEDFSDSERAELVGPRGPRGKSGKGFVFEEHQEAIAGQVRSVVESVKDSLKLKFGDLSENDTQALKGDRGPRGQRGPRGKDFIFEEHADYFESLKLNFEDLTEGEIDSLKLKFGDLSPEDLDSLRLNFSDLTEEDRRLIRGPRGQKGKTGRTGDPGEQGLPGESGARGMQGTRGLPGPIGLRGLPGVHGNDGRDGDDGSYVVSIETEQDEDRFRFVFEYSNGLKIETDWIDIPQRDNHYVVSGGVSSASGSGEGSGGSSSTVAMDCEADVTVGAAVYVKKTNISGSDYDPVIALALADNEDTARVIGFVATKPTTTTCELHVAGATEEIFTGLDVYTDYYLSDSVAGELVAADSVPTTSGSFIVRVGQALTDTRLLYSRGELLEIG